jgi:hypothetical protein
MIFVMIIVEICMIVVVVIELCGLILKIGRIGDKGAAFSIIIILIMFLILFLSGLYDIFFIFYQGIRMSTLGFSDVIISHLTLLVAHIFNLNFKYNDLTKSENNNIQLNLNQSIPFLYH